MSERYSGEVGIAAKKMMKNRPRFSLIFFGLILVMVEANPVIGGGGTVPLDPAYPILRDIDYGFVLRNKANVLLKEAELWTYAPVKRTSAQKCIKLEASDPYRVIGDDLGNQVLHFRIENLPPHGVKTITIRAALGLSDLPNPLPGDVRPFLRSERYIESGHPEIAQFARQFESGTPRKTAESLFQWVADNIKYAGYLRDSRGALYALRTKRGDCTEYADLFIALCRASKIPARGMAGYVCAGNTFLNPGAYHNWAEFYEDGAWRIADPQKKIFLKDMSQYIAMRIVGESANDPMGEFNKFRILGDRLEVRMIPG